MVVLFFLQGDGAAIAYANSFIDQSLPTCIEPDPSSVPPSPICMPANVAAAQTLCIILNDMTGENEGRDTRKKN